MKNNNGKLFFYLDISHSFCLKSTLPLRYFNLSSIECLIRITCHLLLHISKGSIATLHTDISRKLIIGFHLRPGNADLHNEWKCSLEDTQHAARIGQVLVERKTSLASLIIRLMSKQPSDNINNYNTTQHLSYLIYGTLPTTWNPILEHSMACSQTDANLANSSQLPIISYISIDQPALDEANWRWNQPN